MTKYDCEWDLPCDCEGCAPEWEWDEDEEVWKCTSCGAIQ